MASAEAQADVDSDVEFDKQQPDFDVGSKEGILQNAGCYDDIIELQTPLIDEENDGPLPPMADVDDEVDESLEKSALDITEDDVHVKLKADVVTEVMKASAVSEAVDDQGDLKVS